ncbi:MAG: calcium/sodium antiporter [Candidatus Puniceispirillaceae bacterium]
MISNIWDSLFWLMSGLAVLLTAGHYLIPATLGLATRLRLPAQTIAVLVVAGGTSAPELLVSLDAGLSGQPDIALGNIIGSNITNFLLVLGLGALFFAVRTDEPASRRDLMMLLAVTLIFALSGFLFSALSFVISFGLVVMVGFYIRSLLKSGALEAELEADIAGDDNAALEKPSLMQASLASLACVAGLLIGANWMVDGAVQLAEASGISSAVIALTIVAIGTSLPEIAAVVASLLHKRGDMALGNVLGSNIFNLAAIGGLTGLVAPLPFSDQLSGFALPWLIGITGLLALLIWRGRPLGRVTALLLLCFYGLFLAMSAAGLTTIG